LQASAANCATTALGDIGEEGKRSGFERSCFSKDLHAFAAALPVAACHGR
tara:strand:- start:30 stop:179 length:150 start_codon:yes stop_codon:yes gene_type:complete